MIIRSRRVVTPRGVSDCAVHVEGGKILAIIPSTQPRNADVIDVGDLVLSPGIVDPHVHGNEPGRTEWEGFETLTRAAAAGGITTIVDMPLNSSPVTTTPHALHLKLAAASGKLHVDCAFHAGIIPENAWSLLPLLSSGVVGVKAFLMHSGIDEFPNVDESDLRVAMPVIASSGLPLLVHAELQTPVAQNISGSARDYRTYLASRPRQWENEAIALMIQLCREFRCRVHIVHMSSSEALPMLRAAKAEGLPMTAETCPHYLFFAAEEIPDGATAFKCAPPIRERENNELLWSALREGVLDCIASDHSPCPPEMKHVASGDFLGAWGGIASLQWSLSIAWTYARDHGGTLEDLARWMSHNTAALIGLEKQKGTIAAGCDADFVVWDPEVPFTVERSQILHRHKLTPYEGRTLYGKVHATYLRGEKVFDDGTLTQPIGQVLLRT
ncbi:MAG: allantoinase AllB [Ignavibacteria bacterium]